MTSTIENKDSDKARLSEKDEETLIPLLDISKSNCNSGTMPDKIEDDNFDAQENCGNALEETVLNGSENGKCEKDAPRENMRYLGLFLAFISAMMFSLNTLMVKLMSNMNPFNLCLWTFPISATLTIPLLLFETRLQKQNIFGNIFPLRSNFKTIFFITLRALTSIGALTSLYFSFKYLPVGDATVIASSSTVFVYFVSWIFLREEISCLIVTTGVFTLAGVAIITRPPLLTGGGKFDFDLLVGAGLACGCMILVTIAMIAVRFLQNVHHALLNLVLYSWGTVQSILLTSALGVFQIPQTTKEVLLIVASGVLNLLAQTFLAVALQLEQAGPVALVRTCEVIFTFILQMVFLSAIPDILSFIGAFMIFTGVVITIIRKWVLSLPKAERPCCKST